MEKSNSRSSSAKLNNSDPKVKQDVTNKHLRLPRVKESVSPRPEARWKPNPQKSRELFDKRPRHRAGAVCERYRSEITEDHVDEQFNKKGSKKMNLNHLLNFTLAPLETRDAGTRRGTFNRTKLPKYNKELFLQANCQFVARDDGNYSVHEKNPDILVEWPLIEEIRLPGYEVPLCPICLYSPIAAKITRCGHIYCWPCMLHYLALTDRTWQKCPICFEAVHKNELKSVSLRIQVSHNVGDEITMCLMKRVKDSLVATPVTCENPKQVCNVNTDDSVARFQKLLLANKKDIFNIINRERSELETAYAVEKNTPEACFIESALKSLEEREKNMNADHAAEEKQVLDTEFISNNTYQRSHLESMSSTDSRDENFSYESGDQNSDCQPFENAPKGTPSSTSQEIPIDSEKKEISYFYQAEDGQHIYLHNINVRMLLKKHATLDKAPPLIKGKIVEVESKSMTESLRRKLRYLQHLPLTCEFQIVELNFSHMLDRDILDEFGSEINKRKQSRNRKARDERRREKYIEIQENKKLGKYPKATYNLESIDQFPSYQPSDFQPLSPLNYGTDAANVSASKPVGQDCHMVEINSSPGNSDSYLNGADAVPATSFAQMLKDGPKTFSQIPKEKKKVEVHDDNDDEEERVHPLEYHQSFSDAIQAALESVTLQNTTGTEQKAGKKKKKGKKHQLLFTTSMCRNK